MTNNYYPTQASSNKKRSPLAASLPLVSALVAIGVNYYGETGNLWGTTNKEISALNDTAITPAGMAFSIWSLLYIGSIAIGVYLLTNRDQRWTRVSNAFIVANLANAAFPLLFHTGNMPLSLLSTITLTTSLAMAYAAIPANLPSPTAAQRWFLKFPTQLYLGWAAAATAVNLAQAFQQLGWREQGNDLLIWSAFVLIFLALVGIALLFKLGDTVTPISIAWALYWIGVAQSDMKIIPMIAFVGAGILLFAVAIGATQQWAVRKRSVSREFVR